MRDAIAPQVDTIVEAVRTVLEKTSSRGTSRYYATRDTSPGGGALIPVSSCLGGSVGGAGDCRTRSIACSYSRSWYCDREFRIL